MESILKSTERSIWTKINTILMLIWHGSGFAFRYTRPPHLKEHQISTRRTIEEMVFTNMGTGLYYKIIVINYIFIVIN